MNLNKKIKLSDHLKLEQGRSPGAIDKCASTRYVKNSIPYPTQSDVDKNTGIITSNKYWLLPNFAPKDSLIKKGQLMIFRSGNVGEIVELGLEKAFIDERFFKIIIDDNISKSYIKNFFIYNKKTIQKFKNGTAIQIFVVNEFNDWLSTKQIPSLEFQIKPSLLFEKIENKILHNHLKLQKIEQVRKALLAKMFVSEANTHTHTHTHTPTIRFNGFEDKWHRVSLSEILDVFRSGKRPGIIKSQKTKRTPYPMIGNGKGENALMGYTNEFIIKKNCITLSGAGTIGYPQYRDYYFYPVKDVACLTPFSNNDAKFIRYALNDYKFAPTIGPIQYINSAYIKSIQIFTASFIEQQKIGELFNKFDKLIDKINNKIKKLKDIKESFMNREFSKLNN
ncbi:restriction endonuclease subunit S [Mycoplasma sp. E35C]|uniref:restriction endonuclease subunit S n=1 Tax=Mycoplasma sp. E35C TaxID=2801918 RepID=UPI001CA3E609|nr:restriction endonuclease subunit S [Mycoplasma sp. E35C]QZX48903.1 restriction endonuclease subunit S [Mycoplasma sp. E35C]